MELKERLTIIADELNVRQVVHEADGGVYVLEFDTIEREAKAFTFTEATNA